MKRFLFMIMIATLLAGGITFAQEKSSTPTEQTSAKAERSRHARHKAMVRHAKYHKKVKRAKAMRHRKVAHVKRHLHKKMAMHQG